MKVLVLLSGGLDSMTTACKALHEGNIVGAITFLYGQKASVEVECAREVVKALGVKEHIIKDVSPVFTGSHSALLSSREIPRASYSELRGELPTYVPVRNLVFLTIAAAHAVINDYNEVWIGTRKENYPDCRDDVVGAVGLGIYTGSYEKVRVRAPLSQLSKTEVVALAHTLGAPIELTRSCYSEGEVCGVCPSCLERKEALDVASLSGI